MQQHDKNNTAQVAAGLATVALAEDRLAEADTLIAESTTLRQELGENLALAESKLIHSEILLEQNNAAAAEKSAREAAATFRRFRLGQGRRSGDCDRPRPTGARERAGARSRHWLRRRNSWLTARTRGCGSGATARRPARCMRFAGRMRPPRFWIARSPKASGWDSWEWRLRSGSPSMEAGKTPASQLASDAQQSGFLLIARKARR